MGFLSTLAKVGGFAAAPFTGGASIPIGLGVGGALDAASQQGKANEAQEQAMAAMQQDLAARQPFRDQLFASLQNQPQRQDLSGMFQSENPFASALGPLNPQQQQAAAPIMPGPVGQPPVQFNPSRQGGGIDPATIPTSRHPRFQFGENERRFGGRFEGDN